jgi:hypothetical protein
MKRRRCRRRGSRPLPSQPCISSSPAPAPNDTNTKFNNQTQL